MESCLHLRPVTCSNRLLIKKVNSTFHYLSRGNQEASGFNKKASVFFVASGQQFYLIFPGKFLQIDLIFLLVVFFALEAFWEEIPMDQKPKEMSTSDVNRRVTSALWFKFDFWKSHKNRGPLDVGVGKKFEET